MNFANLSLNLCISTNRMRRDYSQDTFCNLIQHETIGKKGIFNTDDTGVHTNMLTEALCSCLDICAPNFSR